MFLEMLKDNQKELFLQLAIMAAKANGKIEAAEHEMLIKFADEMHIEPIADSEKSFDELIDEMVGVCGKPEKKIILFETVGIMNSDGDFDENETEFLSKIASKFEISNEELEYMMELVTAYIDVFTEIVNTVIEEE
ncbi:MAG: hypothetical protein K6G75_05185 [Lachnospiraceae bacterium]|nr:hypothetical protein [Lachnospiraceae bacterium]